MAFNPLKTLLRALGAAFVACALFFFVGNFLGIVGLAIYAGLTHNHVDFSLAYRAVGLPVAIVAALAAFAAVWYLDLRDAGSAAPRRH